MKYYSFLKEDFDWSGAAIGGGIGGTAGAIAGGGLGLGLGFYTGNKLVNKISGRKQRDIIKNIILSSNSPNDCINKLNQLKTTRALVYIQKINAVKTSPDWKLKVLRGINVKNIAGTTAGLLAGGTLGYYGGKYGAIGGGALGGIGGVLAGGA